MDGKRVEKNWEKSGGIGHSQIPRAGCKFCWKIEKKLKFLRVLEGKKFPKKTYGKMALDPSVLQHFSALSWIRVGGREGMEFWECSPGISGDVLPWNFGAALPEFLGMCPWNFGAPSLGFRGCFPPGFGVLGMCSMESRGRRRLSGILYSVGIDSIKLQWFHPCCALASLFPGFRFSQEKLLGMGRGGRGGRGGSHLPQILVLPPKKGLGKGRGPLCPLPVSPTPPSPPGGLKSEFWGF